MDSFRECRKDNFIVISQQMKDSEIKMNKVKDSYDLCLKEESNEDNQTCKALLRAYENAKWNYESWKTYHQNTISMCDSLKKYIR